MIALRDWTTVVALALGAGCCAVVAAEKADEIVHGGRPIALGPAVKGTQLYKFSDVKFRMGKFPDGKPALVASGMVELQWPGPAAVGLAVHPYMPRPGIPNLVMDRVGGGTFSNVVAAGEVGKPAKFYVAGGIWEGKSLRAGVYYVVAGEPSFSADSQGQNSTVRGRQPDEIVHEGVPITLGPVVKGTEWYTVSEVKFRMGKFLDGKPALVASVRLDLNGPVESTAGARIHAYVHVQRDGRPNPELVRFATIDGSATVKPSEKSVKFYAAGYVDNTSGRGYALPEQPDNLVYTVSR